ncbi:hypothetical protein F2P81_025242 [Scophthalmus maximus]|uniref:Uncharacterized protein n=1 Tax=Scophthalmus maximus TaxID=52904 RepID=A0A6A4RJJ2_SCOMX|nr:hypothetical protein F2P81_025242 [Scophthalmus maximus]
MVLRSGTIGVTFRDDVRSQTDCHFDKLEVVGPFQLYFNPELIIRRYQIWRLVTNFLFFGSLGFSFLFNIIFLYLILSRRVEKTE